MTSAAAPPSFASPYPTDPNARPSFLRRWMLRAFAGTRKAVDHQAVLDKVHDEGRLSARYALLTLASAGIATLGLMQNSVAVIIGAMLVAPLMGPILALGFAIATGDTPWIRRSAMTLAVGSALALALAVGIVLLSPITESTSEIMARTRPTLFDLGVALFSALAGAYALIKGREGTIIGVAIATALMPPLGVVGFGLANGDSDIWQGALLLFTTNFMTIALAAALTARFYGFSHQLTPRQTTAQTLGILAAFALLAVPLVITLRQIAFETRAQTSASSALKDAYGDQAQVSGLAVDTDADPIRVRAVVLAPTLRDDIDDALATDLTRTLGRPVSASISQFRLGTADAQAVSDAKRAAVGGSPGAGAASAAAEAAALQTRLAALRDDLDLLAEQAEAPDADTARTPAADANSASDAPRALARSVVIDPETRRAIVFTPPARREQTEVLEGLRDRIADRHPDWEITLLPAPRPVRPAARAPTATAATAEASGNGAGVGGR